MAAAGTRTVTITEEMRLDVLAQQTLGSEGGGNLELLLAANPGLASAGPFAPERVTIAVPLPPTKPAIAAATVNPWD